MPTGKFIIINTLKNKKVIQSINKEVEKEHSKAKRATEIKIYMDIENRKIIEKMNQIKS